LFRRAVAPLSQVAAVVNNAEKDSCPDLGSRFLLRDEFFLAFFSASPVGSISAPTGFVCFQLFKVRCASQQGTIASMVLSIVAIRPMSADPQYVFHPASLPGVTLIEANTPEFLPLVTSLVDPAVLSSIQLPFSYVLKNTSNKFIIVYSTRWTLITRPGT
jgi:hypothetical protein